MPTQRRADVPPPASAPDLPRLEALADAARERLGAAAVSVALVDDDELVYVAASGTGADQVRGMRLPVGRGIGGFVAASGQALVVADVRRDPRHDREAAARSGYLPTSILAVPVEDAEGPVGVLTVLDRQVRTDDLERAADAAAAVSSVLAAAAPTTPEPPTTELLQSLVDRLAERPEADRVRAARLLREVLET